ncbi:hypothetical protein O6P37_04315 [Mycobacterium sp. CPCC 205372]|uniref:Uncharacterized protein n=1 Tax=Mycobacterium hippophais TaxID=3016340 RepID=A0ABT4PND5_9MYCO|nr:hypothetical protein [Mycobacterium hippophais]MCZ8378077.1 hypothetical protein [Mycobacterium hippophais]
MRRPVAAARAVTLGLIVAACGNGKPPASFPPGVAVTNCSATSISFAG